MSILELILYPTIAAITIGYATISIIKEIQKRRAQDGKDIYYRSYYKDPESEKETKRKYEMDANVYIEAKDKITRKKGKCMLAYIKLLQKNEKMD